MDVDAWRRQHFSNVDGVVPLCTHGYGCLRYFGVRYTGETPYPIVQSSYLDAHAAWPQSNVVWLAQTPAVRTLSVRDGSGESSRVIGRYVVKQHRKHMSCIAGAGFPTCSSGKQCRHRKAVANDGDLQDTEELDSADEAEECLTPEQERLLRVQKETDSLLRTLPVSVAHDPRPDVAPTAAVVRAAIDRFSIAMLDSASCFLLACCYSRLPDLEPLVARPFPGRETCSCGLPWATPTVEGDEVDADWYHYVAKVYTGVDVHQAIGIEQFIKAYGRC
jgi:hypothetical protein